MLLGLTRGFAVVGSIAGIVALATPAAAVELELGLAPVAGADRCAEGARIVAGRTAAEEGGASTVTAEVPELPSRLRLPVDPAQSWKIELLAPGCWSAPVATVAGAPEAAELRLVLWPTGSLAGRVELPADAQPEGALHARFSAPPGRSAVAGAAGETLCPMEGSTFRCELPATPLDLRLSLPGFAPHYLWDVAAEAAVTHDLGTFEMVAGASLVGRVEWGGDPTAVSVTLAPEVLASATTAVGRRLGSRSDSVGIDRRGRFQLVGLAAGRYVLIARAGETATSAQRDGIELHAGAEQILDEPLAIVAPTHVQVFVSPPFDHQLMPWNVELERELPGTTLSAPVASGETAPDGSFEPPALERGIYHVVVEDSEGSRLHRGTFEAGEGTVRVDVSIAAVVVRGELKRGGESAPGRLLFTRAEGERTEMIADDEGLFSGMLAAEGEWLVEILPREGRRQRLLGVAVEVVRGEDGIAWLPIELPATRLEGVVEDGDGEPVSRALISAFRGSRPVAQVWAEGGGFEIDGLEPGPLELRAESGDGGRSEIVAVDLDEAGNREPVTLVVSPGVRLTVEVRFEGRPVAGARIRYFRTDRHVQGEVTCGPSGRVELVLPPGIEELDLIVHAARLPTRITRLRVAEAGGPRAPVRLDLPSPAGWLLLPLDPERQRIVFGGVIELPVWQLLPPWGGGAPPGYDAASGIVRLAVGDGDYLLCDGDHARCTGGSLLPGGMLDLRTGEQGTDEPSQLRPALGVSDQV